MSMKRAIIFLFIVGVLILPFTGFSRGLRSGEDIYTTHCWNCHGIRGQSEIPSAIPSFAKKERLYKPDTLLFQSIWNGTGREGLHMGPWKGWLTEGEVWEVIFYIKKYLPEGE